jgi:hypothetical protein
LSPSSLPPSSPLSEDAPGKACAANNGEASHGNTENGNGDGSPLECGQRAKQRREDVWMWHGRHVMVVLQHMVVNV